MLRPIHQLKISPSSTAAQPTHTMMVLVRCCDADSFRRLPGSRVRAPTAMILSASGSMRSLDVSMLTTHGRTFDEASAHCAKMSA